MKKQPSIALKTIELDQPLRLWLNKRAKAEDRKPEELIATILAVWKDGEDGKGLLAGIIDPKLPISAMGGKKNVVEMLDTVMILLTRLIEKTGIGAIMLQGQQGQQGQQEQPAMTISQAPQAPQLIQPKPTMPIQSTTSDSDDDIAFANDIKMRIRKKATFLGIVEADLFALYSQLSGGKDFDQSIDVKFLDQMNVMLANAKQTQGPNPGVGEIV